MKRLIFIHLLLTIAWLPYSSYRWLTLPYSKENWESYILYGSAGLVVLIALLNTGLIFFYKHPKVCLLLLKGIAYLLFLLLFFPIIMGGLNAYYGTHAWVDVIVLGILYGNMQWLHKVYQNLVVTCTNDNS